MQKIQFQIQVFLQVFVSFNRTFGKIKLILGNGRINRKVSGKVIWKRIRKT